MSPHPAVTSPFRTGRCAVHDVAIMGGRLHLQRKWQAFWLHAGWVLGVCLGVGIGGAFGESIGGGTTRPWRCFLFGFMGGFLGSLFGIAIAFRDAMTGHVARQAMGIKDDGPDWANAGFFGLAVVGALVAGAIFCSFGGWASDRAYPVAGGLLGGGLVTVASIV